MKSKYTKRYNSISSFYYGDYIYNGEINSDTLVWDAGSSSLVNHTETGRVCNYGDLNMVGKYVYFYLSNNTYTRGFIGSEPVKRADGTTVNITVYDGTISTDTRLGSLPSGATCYSASGSFPGCERPLPEEPIMCTSVGNPINFALGVKHQTESDYNGGLLSLSRLYRSDARTDTGLMGKNWRHNFDRNANIIITPETTTVDVTDTDGSNAIFLKDTATGDWEATTVDNTDTFEDVFDGTTHVGYLRTTASDTREHYDLDGLMARI